MQLSVYKDAIEATAIPKLNTFLKDNEDTQPPITGWGKMKSGDKRDQLLKLMEANKPLRELFVQFYAEETDTEQDFSEWEAESAEAATDAVQTVQTPAPIEGEVQAPQVAASATFVEGAFEEMVSNVAGMDAVTADSAFLALEDQREFEHIRLGILLGHIQASEHFTTLGFSNLREYLAARTDLEYRKAIYYINNARKVQELGLKPEQLKGVTWSALRHIVGVMEKKNAKSWLDAARTLTQAALLEKVRAAKQKQAGALPAPDKGEAGEKPAPSLKQFQLYPDQKNTVEAAIEKAKGEAGVESTGAALDVIASAYTGSPPSNDTISMAKPDLSNEGFTNMLSKVKAEEGNEGAIRVLTIIGELWDELSIEVKFVSEESDATEAEAETETETA